MNSRSNKDVADIIGVGLFVLFFLVVASAFAVGIYQEYNDPATQTIEVEHPCDHVTRGRCYFDAVKKHLTTCPRGCNDE